jgi:hypothetical protein
MEDWFTTLKDLPLDLVQASILEFKASPSAFPPNAGQIRDRAIRLTKRANKVPSAAEAWEEVLKAPTDGVVRWSEETADGWVIYNQPYQWNSPIVGKVARNMGWPEHFWTDFLAADRSRFIQAYEKQLESATEEITSLPEVREYLERGQADIKQLLDSFQREALERGE